MKVRMLGKGEEKVWDAYVLKHTKSTLCHLSGWRRVIEDTYGHKSYYLMAESAECNSETKIAGILPLIYIKSLLFGNSLVSMPFLNYGGLLADDEKTEILLLEEARRLGRDLRINSIELRQIQPISWMNGKGAEAALGVEIPEPMTHKVRMVLNLPESSAMLFDSFKSKLRSQIRKPQKEGLVAVIGGAELLDEYYHVFAVNMRDLGSPVHSKKLFENILKEFGVNAKLGIVKYNSNATAAGLVFCFRDTVEIIWASALREYNHLSPNMLLYWSLLEYVTGAGYRYFDFGRSTPEEGTYRFKEQWGAKPVWLHWYEVNTEGNAGDMKNVDRKSQLRQKGEKIWQKIPICFANMIGPAIRRQIPL
jgi:FemAB-related protein (PEP-CTERM system-associated)